MGVWGTSWVSRSDIQTQGEEVSRPATGTTQVHPWYWGHWQLAWWDQILGAWPGGQG